MRKGRREGGKQYKKRRKGKNIRVKERLKKRKKKSEVMRKVGKGGTPKRNKKKLANERTRQKNEE